MLKLHLLSLKVWISNNSIWTDLRGLVLKSADIRSLIAVGSSLARCTSEKVPLEDGLMFFFFHGSSSVRLIYSILKKP